MVDRGREYVCPSCEQTVVLAHATTSPTIICPHCDRQMKVDGQRGIKYVGHRNGLSDDYQLVDEDAPQHEQRIPDQ